ncbi:MAG: ABC transporter ATP-binding protein [Kiloniellaceae bacterium]
MIVDERRADSPASDRHAAEAPILEVSGLRTEFRTGAGIAAAVDDVSYAVRPGETLAVVGESGSGKSVTALSIMGLIPNPPGRVVAGSVRYAGRELLGLSDRELQRIRGNEISMIFQEPMTSLTPVLSIGRQLMEPIVQHMKLGEQAARSRAVEMLRLVNIPEPERRLRQYPHQLSGGMLQRVMIAMALSCNPRVLIADEPTTALDVTIQAQILHLMKRLQEEFTTGIVLITHDMAVVAEVADRVIVMYCGRAVEEGPVEQIFETPRHPYTLGLLGALPRLRPEGAVGDIRLNEIPGIVPPLTRLPAGCRFAPRCGFASDRCRAEYPPFEKKSETQWAACWHSDKLPGGA